MKTVETSALPIAVLAADAKALSPEEFEAAHGSAFLLFMPADLRGSDKEALHHTRQAKGPAGFTPSNASGFLVLPIATKSEDGSLLVGRGEGNDVIIDDEAVSHVHACLRREPSGGWVAFDAVSTNGTRVNEIEAPTLDSGLQGVPLAPMARLRLGSFEATFVDAKHVHTLARRFGG